MAFTKLTTPFSEEQIRALSVGDSVRISGLIYTGRDRFHKHVAESAVAPVSLSGGALFHCGPVVTKDENGQWRIVAAGPTTSSREEPYMSKIIREQGLRAIIGKGGMGESTRKACAQYGCVYLQAVGGAAAIIARCIKHVVGVYFLDEFGATEACWALEVEDLPAQVAMDAQGNSLYESVRAASRKRLDELVHKR